MVGLANEIKLLDSEAVRSNHLVSVATRVIKQVIEWDVSKVISIHSDYVSSCSEQS